MLRRKNGECEQSELTELLRGLVRCDASGERAAWVYIAEQKLKSLSDHGAVVTDLTKERLVHLLTSKGRPEAHPVAVEATKRPQFCGRSLRCCRMHAGGACLRRRGRGEVQEGRGLASPSDFFSFFTSSVEAARRPLGAAAAFRVLAFTLSVVKALRLPDMITADPTEKNVY